MALLDKFKTEKAIIEQIFDIDKSNKRNIEILQTKIQSPSGIVPFVGAGMSVPFSYKGWIEFIRNIGKDWGLKNEIEKLITDSLLEDAADLLINTRTKKFFDFEIMDEYKAEKIGQAFPNYAAVTVIPPLTNRLIITTNFDQVLEKVFVKAGKDIKNIIKGPFTDTIEKAIDSGQLTLIKIHGDVEESSNRIISSEDYNLYYNTRGFTGLFKKLMTTYCLVFFGCSLNIDRTLILLKEVAEMEILHFTFLQDPGTADKRSQRINELAKLKILPIWYLNSTVDPKHTSLYFLLTYISKNLNLNTIDSNFQEGSYSKKVVQYNDIDIYESDAQILHILENYIKTPLPKVEKIVWNTFGVIITNQRVTGIGLYNKQLSSLPEKFWDLKGISYLNLSHNNLSFLSDKIDQLINVNYFDISYNKLKSIPNNITALSNLQFLNLSQNEIETLPIDFGKLTNLKELYLNSNKLASIPSSFVDIKGLYYLNLKENSKLGKSSKEFVNYDLVQKFISQI